MLPGWVTCLTCLGLNFLISQGYWYQLRCCGANYDMHSSLLAYCGCLISSNYPLFSYNFNKNNPIILIILYNIVVPLVFCTMLILLNGKKNLDGNFAYSNILIASLKLLWQFLLHLFLLSIKNKCNWNWWVILTQYVSDYSIPSYLQLL